MNRSQFASGEWKTPLKQLVWIDTGSEITLKGMTKTAHLFKKYDGTAGHYFEVRNIKNARTLDWGYLQNFYAAKQMLENDILDILNLEQKR